VCLSTNLCVPIHIHTYVGVMHTYISSHPHAALNMHFRERRKRDRVMYTFTILFIQKHSTECGLTVEEQARWKTVSYLHPPPCLPCCAWVVVCVCVRAYGGGGSRWDQQATVFGTYTSPWEEPRKRGIEYQVATMSPKRVKSEETGEISKQHTIRKQSLKPSKMPHCRKD